MKVINLDFIINKDLDEIKKDEFLYSEMDNLYNLFKECYTIFKSGTNSDDYSSISKQEIITLVYDFFRSFDKDFADCFFRDYSNGKINYSKNVLKNSFSVYSACDWGIDIVQTDTLRDGLNLVHEYSHKLGCNFSADTSIDVSFGEIAPIYSELLFKDYLKSVGIDIDLASRRKYTERALHFFLFEYPMVNYIKQGNVINESFYELNKKYYDFLEVSKEKFDDRIFTRFKNYMLGNKSSALSFYDYAYGTIFASFLHNSSSNNFLPCLYEKTGTNIYIQDFFEGLPKFSIEKCKSSVEKDFRYKQYKK